MLDLHEGVLREFADGQGKSSLPYEPLHRLGLFTNNRLARRLNHPGEFNRRWKEIDVFIRKARPQKSEFWAAIEAGAKW